MRHARPKVTITCPFCKGRKMFHPRSLDNMNLTQGSSVICYLCRGRGTIKARSEQMRDVQEAITQIESDRKTRSDLDAFQAQRYRS